MDSSRYFNRRLGICHWNIEGIKSSKSSKLDDPEFSKELRAHDIVALTETHAGPNDHVGLQGYTTFMATRSKHKKARKHSGGIAILVKNNIKAEIEFHKTSADLIWLKLNKKFFQFESDLYIGVVYISPQNSYCTKEISEKTWEGLKTGILKYNNLGNIMLLGDFNARTGRLQCDYIIDDENRYMDFDSSYISDNPIYERISMDKSVNEYGRNLLELCKANRLRILNGRTIGDTIGKFTCYQWNGCSVVDYCIVTEDLLGTVEYFHIHDLKGLYSNHSKLSLQIPSKFNFIDNNEEMVDLPLQIRWNAEIESIYNLKLQTDKIKTDITEISEKIEVNDESINENVKAINEILLDALPTNTIRKRKVTKKKCRKKWYDGDCRELKRMLNRANRKFILNPCDMSAREAFFRVRKMYKKTLKFKNKLFKIQLIEKINNIDSKNNKEFWEVVDELKIIDGSKYDNKAALISGETWVWHFKNLLQKRIDPGTELIMDTEFLSEENDLSAIITVSETMEAIKALKSGKSSSLDMIKNEMLNVAANCCANMFTKLFNKILKTGNFPLEWSRNIIVPLHKAGNCHDTNNYRGLALTSCLGKVFTSILNKRLNKFTKDRDIISKLQIGFSEKSQTLYHMFVLKTLMDKYKFENKKLYLGFVDFKKAYDTVWRDGLMYKLNKNGINGKIFNVIKDMYSKSETCIKVDGKRTDFFKDNVGVKQGEVLSPLLFNIYINDVVDVLGDIDSPVLNESVIDCLLYADDLVILSSTFGGLQRKFDNLAKYCDRWKLEINESKSMVLQVSKHGRISSDTIKLKHSVLTNTSKYKYLGVIFDSTGNFHPAKKNIYDRGAKALYKLKSVIDREIMSPKISFDLFNKTVKPVCLYGSEMWASTLKNQSPRSEFEH
ncbi:hypothetical protein FSP39_009605 [Pinctada imbricata]|uniref:Reverse transcriptase domain-containing protein n=1 Tax=Pinctada imbricata TaxID=66713 RepID=A0AA88XC27_PINIB|nr:hypothetical protein FSP39_009605 [Pinctada imbricata]